MPLASWLLGHSGHHLRERTDGQSPQLAPGRRREVEDPRPALRSLLPEPGSARVPSVAMGPGRPGCPRGRWVTEERPQLDLAGSWALRETGHPYSGTEPSAAAHPAMSLHSAQGGAGSCPGRCAPGTSMRVCVHMRVCACVHVGVCTCERMCACAHVCTWVCAFVRVHVGVCTCVCVHVRVQGCHSDRGTCRALSGSGYSVGSVLHWWL